VSLAAGCAKTPEALIARGDQYAREKKYSEATIEYRKAIQKDARNATAYAKLGDAYLAANEPRNALSTLIKASDLAPDNVEVNLKAGNLLLVARRFQDAKTRARNILVKDPKNVRGLVLLGNALAGLRSFDEAVDVAQRAALIDPERGGLFGNVGVLEYARGNEEYAERAFLRGIEADPKAVQPRLGLATLYQNLGRLADAERVLHEALALDPNNVTTNGSLADVLIRDRRPKEAEPFLKRVAESAPSTEASLALADYYVGFGRISEAIAILDKVALTSEGFAASRIRVAMIAWAQGQHDAARKQLEEVLLREPKNTRAMALQARMFLDDDRFDEAEAVVKNALNADPGSADAQVALGRIDLAKGDTDAARKAFVEALTRNPVRTDAQIELARLHLGRREVDTAIGYATSAVKGEQDNLEAWLVLIRCLSVRPEDLPKAEGNLKNLLDKLPNVPELWSLRGIVALQQNNAATARRYFQKSLDIDEDHIEGLSGLTTVDIQTGQIGAARARVEKRIASMRNPSIELLNLAAKVYLVAGNLPLVESTLKKSIASYPNNMDAYNSLAQFYTVQRRLEDAKRAYRAIIAKQPKSASAHSLLGQIYQSEGDIDTARAEYEAAIRVNPQAPIAANNLAWLYANGHGGTLDEALQLAQVARSKMPASAVTADTLGFVYYKKGMNSFSLTLFQQALDGEPRNPVYHYHLGLLYAQLGEDAKARKALHAALSLDPKFTNAAEARRVIAGLVY
jgi:putative PEP-CTERM system TPR-repeat lipoprotein